ncbi:CynX/NimT family MFS transporter [Salinibacillus xinjiangensis]|uniref:MFS transporter n=1 Tax=Salinibacillus xinjiangensis TaxID=1229268 RepID=A0A6G1X827_9BACI|nr:MFS transporter [Salinibacillus xinjiangensis]MRG86958.1 MFS transporter [Salinibacillus xinjiangensis]
MKSTSITQTQPVTTRNALLVFGIILVSFNLRPAITAVGPLIGSIRQDLGISNGIAGFLTTLPLLSFAVFSFLAPRLGIRYGQKMMILAGLIALLMGILVRSIGMVPTVFIGTMLVGVGIAIMNVLLPSIIKTHYPEKIGLMTGTYTASMNVFAALGSGISIPLAVHLGLGWEKSLLFWAFVSVLAMVVWGPQIRKSSEQKRNYQPKLDLSEPSIWRSAIAWQVTVFMGLQSFLFYCTIAWLPEILNGSGLDISTAGWMVSIMQLAGIPMAFFTPILADRFRNQKVIVILIGIVYFTGVAILFVDGGNFVFVTLSVLLIGLGQGASISLSLVLLSLRASSSEQAAQLSGMAQSVGYLLAAIGPTLVGGLFDWTHSWTIPLLLFMAIVIIMVGVGLGAGRDRSLY